MAVDVKTDAQSLLSNAARVFPEVLITLRVNGVNRQLRAGRRVTRDAHLLQWPRNPSTFTTNQPIKQVAAS